jgi:3-phosphoshikimate 1-carboxyvinyltransferase
VDGLWVGVGPSELTAIDVAVPGDISSAAFWMVAGACHPNARIRLQSVGMNPTRDGVIRVLQSMGARIAIDNVREDRAEPTADITVESSALQATEIGGDLIPQVVDELPVLALAACYARGTTVITDAAELRIKESDRILATVEGLSALGASIEESPDGMVVRGVRELKGTATRSHGDHRIAMAMGVAGLVATGETIVEDSEAAGVSYPQFWDTLASLSGSGRERS